MDFNDDDAGPSHYYAHEEVFDEFRSDSDQSDNDSIPPLPPPTVKHRPKTLKGIIATLYLALDGVVRIDVRRDYVLEDALVECKKEDFSPKKLLKVKFALEHAIDLGGPKREFFHLVSTEATKYLIGDFGKFFTTNALAVQNRVLFALGQYCGMSVTQGGNGFPYFHHLVYEYFVTGAVSCTIDIDRDCIPYGILKYILDKLDTADSKDDIQAVFQVDEATEFLYATGYTKPVLNLGLDNKDNIQSILVAYHCFLKVKSEMDQFIEGLCVTGVLDFVRESPSVLKHMFVLIKKKLTAEELKSLFKFECGLEVDSLEPIEKQSWRFFCNFLDMCEDDCGQCIDCTISDVLVFFYWYRQCATSRI
ncbi:PREDICTED: uncharacterized protein LOC109586727 isoform X2 [Amphimedon queenslandica]|nr:PREDICTED: uncharacterized protein LOC109586727 isoform X2 [Amphimedon queenslandica]|eukprot:XP_019858492.1 PREDICTED: uncharacterized protein LOC109586727 isoform X2 [Amphimedon queenslandica]